MTDPLLAVLFDFGDTLFHSPDGVAVLESAGVDSATAVMLWTNIWKESKSPVELARGRDLSPAAHRDAWMRLFEPVESHASGAAAMLYERVMQTDAWIPYPDTREILSALRERGLRVGVVSNIPVPLRTLFAVHGLDGLIDVFVESHAHGITKPDLELFRIACRALDAEPARVLMVGDAAVADGVAVDAGLTVLLLPAVPPKTPRGLARALALAGG